ncbi:unnamed protein product [Cuscuta campestris]|uniref:Uncharacterized protein n=1 Tax=Cuscuta campestris TaxID=132261 RepID=A0A484KH53_9ASTE|nr:unnamed protein product [Cuscuta campestris]
MVFLKSLTGWVLSLTGFDSLRHAASTMFFTSLSYGRTFSERAGPSYPPYHRNLSKGRPLSVPVTAWDRRTVLVNGTPREEWLVQWSDSTSEEATCEPDDDLTSAFPELRLEDKVAVKPGGVDTGVHGDERHESHGDDPNKDGPDEILEDNPNKVGVTSRPRRNVWPPQRYWDYI